MGRARLNSRLVVDAVKWARLLAAAPDVTPLLVGGTRDRTFTDALLDVLAATGNLPAYCNHLGGSVERATAYAQHNLTRRLHRAHAHAWRTT